MRTGAGLEGENRMSCAGLEVDHWHRIPLLEVEHFVLPLQSYAGKAGLEGEDRVSCAGLVVDDWLRRPLLVVEHPVLTLQSCANRVRGGLVFKAHRLVHHSTLGLWVIKKKKKKLNTLSSPANPATRWSATLVVEHPVLIFSNPEGVEHPVEHPVRPS